MDRTQIILLSVAVALFLVSMQLGGGKRPAPGDQVSRGPAGIEESSAPPDGGARAPQTNEGSPPGNPAVEAVEEAATGEVTLRNPDLELQISNEGARLRAARLPQFSDRVSAGAQPVDLATDQEHGLLAVSLGTALPRANLARYRVSEPAQRAVQLELRWSNGAEVVQRFDLDEKGYGGSLSVKLHNGGRSAVDAEFAVGLFGREPPQTGSPEKLQNHRMTVFASEGDSLLHENIATLEHRGFFGGGGPLRRAVPSPVGWVAVESQYFLASVIDDASGHGAFLSSLGPGVGNVSLTYPRREIGPDQELERHYRLYFGPKIDSAVQAVDGRLEPALIVGYAWVRPITLIFEKLLNWLHDHAVANYGFGIVMITLLLRLAMYPLTQKSMTSMRRMSVIQPQLKEIQERYREDSQRQQQEIMALYKRMGLNPLTAVGSGCIPMMIQMPFMIALYFALQGMIELRHAPFIFWINDLSAPENFLTLFGVPIRPLTLLMGGSMFLQTYLQPGSQDAQQQQQRQMMLIMSGVFVVMFYSFPSGLVLYWLVSNLLGIAQQTLINRGGRGAGAPAMAR